MSTAVATVVTLQAEVRVLMMGARQVTKGVFSQLDTYLEDRLPDIEVLGRVAPVDTKHSRWFYWLGRAKWDGTLVRVNLNVITTEDYQRYETQPLIVLAG